MKNFEAYSVQFEGIFCDERKIVKTYNEAIKIFNKYKKNKKYETKRKNAKELTLVGWNYNDVEVTVIEKEDLI